MRYALLLLFAAGTMLPQDIKLPPSIDKLAAKASEVVEVTLDGQMLRLAGKFLSNRDPDEAKVKNLVTGLKGIYVRSFEFDKEGEYSPEDVEAIRSQVRGPAWSRMVGVVSKRDRENAEVYVRVEGDRINGLVIVAAEPKELTVVNIVGTIDLNELGELGGHFGIPEVSVQHGAKKTAPSKD
jgi:hypothetical protein